MFRASGRQDNGKRSGIKAQSRLEVKKKRTARAVSTFSNQHFGVEIDLEVVCSGRWRYSKCRVIVTTATIWYIRVVLTDTHSLNTHKS